MVVLCSRPPKNVKLRSLRVCPHGAGGTPGRCTMRASSLAAGQEKKGELATTCLEFEYLHRKKSMRNADGGDDDSNDVITLGTCF